MSQFTDLLKLLVTADTKGAVSEFNKLEREAGSSLQGVEKQATSSLGGVEQKATTFSGKVKGGFSNLAGGMVASLGPAAIAGGIGAGIGIAINAASNLNEQISKTKAVFGESSGAILKWSDSSATALGQSKTQALEAASSFGNLFRQLGLTGTAVVEMSTSMTGLATDFASFFDTDPATALEAISAAFRGEFDSVQKFVPTINAAAVEQEALKEGLAKTTKELTQQDKAVATYNLLLKGAGSASGDFAKTSGSLANQQRILTGQVKDLAAELGNELLPTVTKLAQIASKTIHFVIDAEINLPGGLNVDIGSAILAGGAKPFIQLGGVIGDVFHDIVHGAGDAKNAVGPAFNAIATSAAQMGAAIGPAGASFGDFVRTAKPAADMNVEFGGSADAVAQNLGHETDALRAANDALTAHTNATLAAFDATFAVTAAQADFAKAHLEATVASQDATKSAGELSAAYDAETQMAVRAAEAVQAKFEKDMLASTGAIDAKKSNDLLISTLQGLAAQASGPTKAALDTLIGTLKDTGAQHAKPTVSLVDNATQPIANVAGAARALNGINPTISVGANVSAARNAVNGLINGLNSISAITGKRFATIAKGTDNFAGGLALVGEQGPELVYLPAGAAVSTASKTKQIMESGPSPVTMKGGGMSGGTVVNIHVSGAVDPYNTARQIQTILAKGNRGGFNTLAA